MAKIHSNHICRSGTQPDDLSIILLGCNEFVNQVNGRDGVFILARYVAVSDLA